MIGQLCIDVDSFGIGVDGVSIFVITDLQLEERQG